MDYQSIQKVISRILVYLGLYDIRTLIAKFCEVFFYNKKRYFHQEIRQVPELSFVDDNEKSDNLSNLTPPKRGGKCIYFLVHCFYPYSMGGTERFIYNMARQAKAESNRVKIITYNAVEPRNHFKNNFLNILFNEYQIDGIDVLEYRHTRAPRGILKDIILTDRELKQFADFIFKREKPDVVHVGYLQKVSSFIIACQENHIPYIITLTSFFCLCHFDIMIDQNGDLCTGSEKGKKCNRSCSCFDVRDSCLRYQKAHSLLKGASFIIGPSQFVRKMVEREFDDIHVYINNHGVSRAFTETASGGTLPRKVVKQFAYFGSIAPLKGIHILIDAFKSLPREYELHIYGRGFYAYLRRLKYAAKNHGNIVFHGGVNFDQMANAYIANQVIVVPSIWYETYNFVLHEALLMNKIVIASRIGAMPEKIVDGVNGYTFIPGDSHDLQRAMQLAIKMGLSGEGKNVAEVNTVEAEFARYNLFYELAINKEELR